jgi:cell division protein FtsL
MSLSVNGKVALLSLLFVLVLVSAISVVYTKHMNRKYFTELQKLQKQKDEMNIEWGQLQLERSTFATSSVIEKSAREKLGMDQPAQKEIISIKP